jgi:hypothetical protein
VRGRRLRDSLAGIFGRRIVGILTALGIFLLVGDLVRVIGS